MTVTVEVGAATRLYCVLGCPVRHTLSPVMQSAALKSCGIDACYLAFEVEPEDLEEAVRGAWKLGFCGLNLTVPHKVAGMALCRELDESAALTGAVNTLVRGDKGWKGYNTDAAGFVRAVRQDLGFRPEKAKALVYGTGGAARAAICGLAAGGVKYIFVAGRSFDSASALAGEFSARLKGAAIKAVKEESAPKVLDAGDLLASATPLGLKAGSGWPWDLKRFAGGVLVYDMAYGQGPTPLQREAAEAGFAAASGLSMLVWQGAEGFSLWTGREPPVDVMKKAVLTHQAG
ncbi:shikimate dehydrogenase [bacterium]|nr:MAG: shikimate dehydrogenase [bacterium]